MENITYLPQMRKADQFMQDRWLCTILAVEAINGEPHYRYYWADDAGKLHEGHAPAFFVDKLTACLTPANLTPKGNPA